MSLSKKGKASAWAAVASFKVASALRISEMSARSVREARDAVAYAVSVAADETAVKELTAVRERLDGAVEKSDEVVEVCKKASVKVKVEFDDAAKKAGLDPGAPTRDELEEEKLTPANCRSMRTGYWS